MAKRKSIVSFLPKKSREAIESRQSITKFVSPAAKERITGGTIRKGSGGSSSAKKASTPSGPSTPISGPVQSVQPQRSTQDRTITGSLAASKVGRKLGVAESQGAILFDSLGSGTGPRVERLREERLISESQPTNLITTSGTISEFRPGNFELESGFRRGGFEATKTFVTEKVPKFITGLGSAIQGNRGVKEINPFNVFSDVGKMKGEKPVSVLKQFNFEPQFGTVTDTNPKGVKEITGFDLLRTNREAAGIPAEISGQSIQTIGAFISKDIGSKVTSQFKGRVKSGELSVEQATTGANIEFQKQFKERTSGLEGLGGQGLRVRTGETVSKTVQAALPVAAIVAAPFTGSASLVALAGIGSAGLGLRAGQESLESFQAGQIGEGSLKLAEAGLFAVGGGQLISGALGPGTSSIVGKQIIGARQEALRAQPFSIGGAEIGVGPKGVLSELSFSKVIPGASQEVGVVIPTFRQAATKSGAEQFSIAGGRFVSKTRVQPFNLLDSAETLKLTEKGSFIGRGGAGKGGRLVSDGIGIEFEKDVTTSIGTIDFLRGGKAVRSSFGGFSTRSDETLNILTGTPTKVRIPIGPGKISFGIKPTGGGQIKTTPKTILDFGSGSSASSSGKVGSSGMSLSGGGQASGLESSQISFKQLGTQSSDATISSSVQAGLKIADIGTSQSIIGTSQSFSGLSSVGGARTFGKVGLAGGSKSQQLSLISPTPQTVQSQSPSFTTNIQSFSPKENILGLPTKVSLIDSQLIGGSGKSLEKPLSLTSGKNELSFATNLDVSLASSLDFRPAQKTRLRVSQESRLRQQFQSDFSPGIGRPSLRGFDPIGASGFGSPFLPSQSFGELGSKKKATKGKGKKKGRIAPSLTGIAAFDLGDITGGPLPTGGLPQTRFVPGKKKKKSSKKKKK